MKHHKAFNPRFINIATFIFVLFLSPESSAPPWWEQTERSPQWENCSRQMILFLSHFFATTYEQIVKN